MCKALNFDGQNYTVCANGSSIYNVDSSGTTDLEVGTDVWWYIGKAYRCVTDHKIEIADDEMSNTDRVQTTLEFSGGIGTYQDYDSETDTVVERTFEIDLLSDIQECERACKVRKPIKDTEAAAEGNVSEYRNSVDSFQEIVKKCDGSTCPVETGEVIVKHCSCLNDFPEAVSTLQMLYNAAKDLICSAD